MQHQQCLPKGFPTSASPGAFLNTDLFLSLRFVYASSIFISCVCFPLWEVFGVNSDMAEYAGARIIGQGQSVGQGRAWGRVRDWVGWVDG